MIEQLSARHAFVYCAPDRLGGDAIDTVHPDDAIIVGDWIRAGRPLIARMRRSEDTPDRIALGLPLPLDSGKKKIAVTAKPLLLESVEAPPLLRDVLDVLPPQWQARIARLSQDLTPHATSVRIVGSLAWQFLTREIYLHPKSDIDILVSVATIGQLRAVLGLLGSSDLVPGPRVDGEIVTPDGDAVSWRELLGSSGDVLVKNLGGPRIALRDQWLSGLRERAA
jgi:phosphoribosyl-dephospho-CoA transferase